jgi:protein arginine kinase
MNIRGVYGEGSEALGDVYLLSNQVSLGRSEQELISMVTTLGHQLMDMEQSLRAMALQDGRLPLEDVIWRAYGVLSNARILPMNEFYDHWSNLRLGVALGMIDLPLDQVDSLLDMAQSAHLCCWREETLTGRDLDQARADKVREVLIS